MQQKIPLVHASRVSKLGGRHGGATVIFDDMTVTLPTNQICAVLGRQGSGRSTFLRLLSGTERADSGAVLSEVQFSVIGNASTYFHPSMTGIENIVVAARLYGMDPAMLTELTLGLYDFGALWQSPAGLLPLPRRKAMEMLVASLLPFDCYLVDDVERTDPDVFKLVLQILQLRQAGMIFTAQHPKFAREFATFGSVVANQTVYAFASVDEALKNYA